MTRSNAAVGKRKPSSGLTIGVRCKEKNCVLLPEAGVPAAAGVLLHTVVWFEPGE